MFLRVKEELNKKVKPAIRQLFSIRDVKHNILGQCWYFLLIFLFIYYAVAIVYQLDIFCFHKHEEASSCQSEMVKIFAHWEEFETTMSRVVTFLMGFYVSMIAKRWWDQVDIKKIKVT